MVYIYIELRYQRQLNKICPEILEAFFSSLNASVHKNGGTEMRISGGRLFQFDGASVGSEFSSSRVISDLSGLLEKNTNRIREYLVLVDYTEKAVQSDFFIDKIAQLDTVIIPDSGILMTSAAATHLAPYIVSEALPDTPLFNYCNLNFTQNTDVSKVKVHEKTIELSLFTDFVTDPISVFLNLIRLFPLHSESSFSTDEEKSLFAETQSALDMYARFRFSPQQPEYRLAACIEYFELYLKSFIPDSGKTVQVTVYAMKTLPTLFKKFIKKFGEYCEFTIVSEPEFLQFDIQSVPDDLLELSYLVYKSSSFLYADELSSFFHFLGKNPDFLEALGNWMYSFGLLSLPHDFRSLNAVAFSKLEAKLGTRKENLDMHIAKFLWSMYEQGLLQPVFAFQEVFTDLKYTVPDAFLVNCLYHAPDMSGELEKIRTSFRNPLLVDAVEKLEIARNKYEEGSFEASASLAKNVLHVFQKENVITGEYRTLSLIAMLSLARNDADDAVVYLEYALQNAQQLRDSFNILCTSFDMAMVYFIIGNYHFALCTLDSVDKVVGSCYAKDWEVLVYFMRGRIAFELGNYRNAEMLFQTAASLASVHQIPESVSLCRVWYARSLAHLNRFASAENILISCVASIPEAYIFLMESALLSGRSISGISFPPSGASLFNPEDRWTLDKISWKSGFSVAEDRCFGTSLESRLAVRMYEAFYLYYTARFGSNEDLSVSVAHISQIARTALDLKDPFAALYYYFCYDLGLKTKTVLPADTTTFLSRGFKYMQKRANEIEENSIREQYMQNATWNSRLYRMARENMLI